MKNTFIGLHEALSTISTKGQDTITMANCLTVIRQQVKKLEKAEKEEKTKNANGSMTGEFVETEEPEKATTEDIKK